MQGAGVRVRRGPDGATADVVDDDRDVRVVSSVRELVEANVGEPVERVYAPGRSMIAPTVDHATRIMAQTTA